MAGRSGHIVVSFALTSLSFSHTISPPFFGIAIIVVFDDSNRSQFIAASTMGGQAAAKDSDLGVSKSASLDLGAWKLAASDYVAS